MNRSSAVTKTTNSCLVSDKRLRLLETAMGGVADFGYELNRGQEE